jgi:hypothetical protein
MKRWRVGLAFLCGYAAIAHPAILPAPRVIQESAGRFPLRGARICFSSKPSPEDLFTARELIAKFRRAVNISLPLQESACTVQAILLKKTGSGPDVPQPGETAGKDSREAYSLSISTSGVRIEARSSAGLFYAVQTLGQMLEQTPEPSLPVATIEDWPALAFRGLMMDMSHTQLPRLDELKRQIDFLALWKANQYYFYSEATIALDGYPILPPDARFTKSQIRELIDYARRRHIDVIPNQELYGHLHDLFRMERYSDLAPIPYGGEFNPEDPRVNQILSDWIGQLAALFPSPFFHVGFDETWLLEKEAQSLHRTPEELYLEQLNRVAGLVRKNGKVPMAWADMMEKFPRMIPQLPKGLIAVPWHYDPQTDAEYHKFLAPFQAAGVPMMVLSAVMNWHWVTPNYTKSFEVDSRLLAAGLQYGAMGFVNSEWTDNTNAALMRMARPALAHGAILGWQGAPPDDFLAKYAAVVYPEAVSAKIARAVDLLDRSERLLEQAHGTTVDALWGNPFSDSRLARTREHIKELHESRRDAEDAEELFESAASVVADGPTIRAWLVGSHLLNYISLKYIYADQISGFWRELGEHPSKHDVTTLIALETADQYHSRAADMMDAVGRLHDEYRDAWIEEYTPYRLTVGLEKFDTEYQFWWRFQRRVQALASAYREGNSFPPLESQLESMVERP